MTFNVALFPIPNLVAFPGTSVPLHVFEPRYRQMITDCIDNNRMIGVCHTRKQIRGAKEYESMQEALSNNAATYVPQEVFSVGDCELLDTTSDGRLRILVHMNHRVTLGADVQTLPYRIAEVSELLDEPESADELQSIKKRVHERLVALAVQRDPTVEDMLRSPAWTDLEPGEFSFKVFQLLRFDPDLMQSILELTSATDRLNMIDIILNGGDPR